MREPFCTTIYNAITWYRANFVKYYKEIRNREIEFAAELDRDRTFALDWPEQKRDAIRRILGFFIGEDPVCPFPASGPSGLVQAAATGPP